MINNRFINIGLLFTVILLSGCAAHRTSSTSSCVNPASLLVDTSLQGQSNQFSGDLYDCQMTARLKTIGTDALVGAGVGAALGAIIGKATGFGAGYGAAIGAAGGGLVGAGYGTLEADRNQSADTVIAAKQALAMLQQENQRLATFISQANSTAIADNERFAQIQKKLKKRKIKLAIAMQEVEKMNEERNVLQTTLSNLKKRKANIAQSMPKNDPNFTAELQKYQNQINTLEIIVAQIPQRNLSAAG